MAVSYTTPGTSSKTPAAEVLNNKENPPQSSNLVKTPQQYMMNVLPTIPASAFGPGYERLSKPDYANGYVLGAVPRRGWDEKTTRYFTTVQQNPMQGLQQWSQSLPLRLLHVLGDIHPLVGQAASNWLGLSFGPDDTTFVAVNQDGTKNKRGTKAIEELFASLPMEVGGSVGLQSALGEQALFYGTACIEGVVAPDASQLADLVTFDPLSCRFRDETNGKRFVEQRQQGQFRALPELTCLAVGFRASRDNPYGRPIFSAALGEGLQDLQRQLDLNDVLHTTAWPRLTVGFPWEEFMQLALDHPELTIQQGLNGADLTAAQFASSELNRLAALMSGMKADDLFVYPKGAEVKNLNAGTSLTGIKDMFEYNRLRMCAALDTLPALLGITSGGTQAYSSVEWGVQVKKFESFRAFVNKIICRLLDLHLRLLGLNVTSKAETKAIRSSDTLVDEQAKTAQIANTQQLISLGFVDRTSASIELTGKEPAVSDEEHEAKQQAYKQAELNNALTLAAAKGTPSNPKAATNKGDNNTEN